MNEHLCFYAVDPGNTLSAGVLFSRYAGLKKIHWQGKIPNIDLLARLRETPWPVVCEFPYPRGGMVSWQTLETCEVAGMIRLTCQQRGIEFIKMNRHDIKKHLCPGKPRAKDRDVRRALIDRFGGPQSLEGGKCSLCKGHGYIGRKKKDATVQCERCCGAGVVPPGFLHGINADVWQALAVAEAYIALGPSKSAALLQDERKQRRLEQKERDAALLAFYQGELFMLERQEIAEPGGSKKRTKQLEVKRRMIARIEKKYDKTKP